VKSDPIAWAVKAFLFLIVVPPFLCVALSIAVNTIIRFLPILTPAAVVVGIAAGIGRAVAARDRWSSRRRGPDRNFAGRNRRGEF
jgi:hypothetical protein